MPQSQDENTTNAVVNTSANGTDESAIVAPETPLSPAEQNRLDIEAYNAEIDAQEKVEAAKEGAEGDAAETGGTETDAGDTGDDDAADGDSSDSDAAEAETSAAAVVFDEKDSFEDFQQKRDQYLGSVEITPELQAILDRQNAEIETLRSQSVEGDLPVSREVVTKVVGAFDKLFDVDTDPQTGKATPNTKPLVELLRNDYANEFMPIAEEILASDSLALKGHTVFEELLVREFGPEKVAAMLQFAKSNIPLPTVPAGQSLPAFVPKEHQEAYLKLPEVKRFELGELSQELADAQAAVESASEYYKAEAEADLAKLRQKFAAELFALESIQNGLNGERQRNEVAQRQAQQAATQFNEKVNKAYNESLFGIADGFISEIAPKLTYADTDTQVSQARNILTRVQNALSFTIMGDGTFAPDPMAEYYERQLIEEGVKFDFTKGRDLLKRHYTATRKLIALESQGNVTRQALDRAKHEMQKAQLDLKTEQRELVGQITQKYVKSSSAAIEKDISKQQAKKQAAVRPKIGGNGAPVKPNNALDRKSIDADIRRYNAEVDRQIASGDELYAFHNG